MDFRTFGVMNIDSHLDVRPLKEGKAHSGSPFRLLLGDGQYFDRTKLIPQKYSFLEEGSYASSLSKEASVVASTGLIA